MLLFPNNHGRSMIKIVRRMIRMNSTILLWSPRVFAIIYIAFLTLFAFDVFEIQAPWFQQFLGFLIHNIPAILLGIATIFAWKRPIIGGIAFFVAGIAFFLFFIIQDGGSSWIAILTLSLPPIIIGGLFTWSIFQQPNE